MQIHSCPGASSNIRTLINVTTFSKRRRKRIRNKETLADKTDLFRLENADSVVFIRLKVHYMFIYFCIENYYKQHK